MKYFDFFRAKKVPVKPAIPTIPPKYGIGPNGIFPWMHISFPPMQLFLIANSFPIKFCIDSIISFPNASWEDTWIFRLIDVTCWSWSLKSNLARYSPSAILSGTLTSISILAVVFAGMVKVANAVGIPFTAVNFTQSTYSPAFVKAMVLAIVLSFTSSIVIVLFSGEPITIVLSEEAPNICWVVGVSPPPPPPPPPPPTAGTVVSFENSGVEFQVPVESLKYHLQLNAVLPAEARVFVVFDV